MRQIREALEETPPNIQGVVDILTKEADGELFWAPGFALAPTLEEAIKRAWNATFSQASAKPPMPVREEEVFETRDFTGWGGDTRRGLFDGEPIDVRSAPDEVNPDLGNAASEAAPDRAVPGRARFLNAQTQDRSDVGSVFSLFVQVALVGLAPGSGRGSKAIDIGATEIAISVRAPAFDFVGDSEQRLSVPATGDSDEIRFTLRAKTEGVQTIKVTAWNGSVQVGTVELQVAVGAAQQAEPAAKSPMEMRDPEEGEYTLEISRDPLTKVYRFQIRGDGIGVMRPVLYGPLLADVQQSCDTLIEALNQQARNMNRLRREDQADWLTGLGRIMAETLMPPEIRESLWRLKGTVRRLNIFTEGDAMPWELLYVDPPEADPEPTGFFLADITGVVRWRYGPPPPGKIRCVSPQLVQPVGSPAATAAEIDEMLRLYPRASVLTQLSDVRNVLKTNVFGMIHFASHNVSDPEYAGNSYVPFGDAKMDLVFMGNVRANTYRDPRPLVVMNSCTSAGKSPLFTEMSSWSDRYVAGGAGAFLGSLWEVRDSAASKFGLKFHSELCAGRNLGEAMSAARNTLDPGDPTRLAYTLYGNPLATVEPG
ncbi:MAG: CHAT domain-containing protein [Armatimonadetes bacterium]|nr:CHAT domain-containing protein [Armatimonadota bacterium]